jgi:hypothetical protein
MSTLGQSGRNVLRTCVQGNASYLGDRENRAHYSASAVYVLILNSVGRMLSICAIPEAILGVYGKDVQGCARSCKDVQG